MIHLCIGLTIVTVLTRLRLWRVENKMREFEAHIRRIDANHDTCAFEVKARLYEVEKATVLAP